MMGFPADGSGYLFTRVFLGHLDDEWPSLLKMAESKKLKFFRETSPGNNKESISSTEGDISPYTPTEDIPTIHSFPALVPPTPAETSTPTKPTSALNNQNIVTPGPGENCDTVCEPRINSDIKVTKPNPEPASHPTQPSQNIKPNNRDKDTRTLKHSPAQSQTSKSNINSTASETPSGKLSNYTVKPKASSETRLMNGGTVDKSRKATNGPSPAVAVVILEKSETEPDQQGKKTNNYKLKSRNIFYLHLYTSFRTYGLIFFSSSSILL